MPDTDYTEPCDYMAQTPKYGGQANQSGISYDGARAQAQRVIDTWESAIKDLDDLKAEANAADKSYRSFNTPEMGMTVVGTLVDANPDFFRFLDRMEQAQSPSDNSDERDSRPFYLEMFEASRGRTLGEIEATKALFHKDKEDDYYEILQHVGPEYKGTGLDPPLARLEKGPKLLDKIKSFLEHETVEKVKGAKATPSELQDCNDLIEEVDEFCSTFSKDIQSVIVDYS